MDITNVIIPKKSIGGVCIGESIAKIEAGLSGHYKIHKEQNSLTLDDGFIRAYYGPDGIITAISCNSKFTGSYQTKLWAGMTVAEVLKHSKEQIAWSGFVQVDKISGIGLSLLEEHDDFESLTDHFALDFIFDELWVYDF